MTYWDPAGLQKLLEEEGALKPPAIEATFRDDPIALACASYRHYRKNNAARWLSFDSVTVIDEDREHAAEIRKYYGHKLTFDALSKAKISQFRAKLGKYLAGEHRLLVDEVGMLYKLPYFYNEDRALEHIVETTTSAPQHPGVDTLRLVLTPQSTILKTRRGGEVHQYWFRSSEGYGCVLPVQSTNPLRSLIDGLMYRDQVEVSAFAYTKTHWCANHQYYLLSNLVLQ
jgi:hypothetical protein